MGHGRGQSHGAVLNRTEHRTEHRTDRTEHRTDRAGHRTGQDSAPDRTGQGTGGVLARTYTQDRPQDRDMTPL